MKLLQPINIIWGTRYLLIQPSGKNKPEREVREMIVNISRNKLLINKNRLKRNFRKEKKEQFRCNHCGGLVRMDGELVSCIMCSRDKDHFCELCCYKPKKQVSENQKTA